MTTWIVARTALRGTLLIIGMYWAAMVLIVSGILGGIVLFGGSPDISIWSTSGASAPKYFLFAVGAMQTGQLPVYIGHGITRREYVRGALIYLAAVAALYGALMAIGYAVEHPIYAANDLFGALEEPYPVGSVSDGLVVFVEESLVGLVYLVTGWLTGSVFYRLGAWWGVVLIPAMAVPVVAVEMGFDSLWVGFGINNGLDLDPPPLGVGVLVAVAVAAVVWAANYALVRDVPIKKVSG